MGHATYRKAFDESLATLVTALKSSILPAPRSQTNSREMGWEGEMGLGGYLW